MKIEIGESLMRSWLRHVEGCQIAELNWKPSFSWPMWNDTPPLMEAAREYFRKELGEDIFKKQTAAQLLRQAEVDVLGLRLDPPHGQIAKIYCVDVAFHRNGLGYDDVAETVRRVLKKLIRHVMVVHSAFGPLPLQVVFASPKAGAAYEAALGDAMRSLTAFFLARDVPCETLLLMNKSFCDTVLDPVLAASSDIADTSELFLRSYQLLTIFNARLKGPEPSSARHRELLSAGDLRVEFDPAPLDVFKTELLRTKRALRTIHYEDGHTEDRPWNAEKFTVDSDLMQNVLTSRLRHWRRDRISSVQIKIVEP